jgi:mono/diheme cytochrome c family protein/glucose/arabinose dehydrogenase
MKFYQALENYILKFVPKFILRFIAPQYILPILLIGAFLGVSSLGGYYIYRKTRPGKEQYWENSPHSLNDVFFNQIPLTAQASGVFTTLVIAPDGKLYATAIDGVIKRFLLKEDGTLQLEHTIKPFGETKKLLMGLTFEPTATEKNLVAWITYHDFAGLEGAPNWDARIAKLTFSATSDSINHRLVITNLPRSAKDHLTNSLAFGKDSALYVNQGCLTWMGRSCRDGGVNWDEGRDETLLAGTVLRLDLKKLPAQLPLDVKTTDGGGNYDPFASHAPLTMYATGVRNAYDLVWHSNGNLYIAVNGASDGGCTPTSNPNDEYYLPPLKTIRYSGRTDVPAINGVKIPQDDFLLEIHQGKYYGQPNPIRAEYVINRGKQDINYGGYETLTAEENFFPPVFSFGKHASPTGTIEYKSNTFGGKLKGMLMVARYNMYADLLLIKIDEQTKKVVAHYDGAKIGLGKIWQPLDVVEDPKTGNLYISQYGIDSKITLCKPSQKPNADSTQQTKTPPKDSVNVENVVLLTDDQNLQAGKNMYLQSCAVCHGEKGQGLVGPNLVDKYWIHGNTISDVFNVITKGVLEKGMPGWEDRLTGKQIQQMSSYILSLQGTNPPNPRNPEGKEY